MTESGRARLLAQQWLRCQPTRLSHSAEVAALVQRTASSLQLPEGQALVAAAWLHDVGYGTGSIRTGLHALDGACRAAAAGMSSLVVDLIGYYSGAQYEAKVRGLHQQLQRIAPPPPLLLDTLNYADASISPDGHAGPAELCLSEALHRHQQDAARHEALLQARPSRLVAVASTRRRLLSAALQNRADSRPDRPRHRPLVPRAR